MAGIFGRMLLGIGIRENPPLRADPATRVSGTWVPERETSAARGPPALRPPRPVFPQISTAEDARFELARGCPQHAFQQC